MKLVAIAIVLIISVGVLGIIPPSNILTDVGGNESIIRTYTLPNELITYSSDDGSPEYNSYYITAGQSWAKSFPDVVVPDDSDLIVSLLEHGYDVYGHNVSVENGVVSTYPAFVGSPQFCPTFWNYQSEAQFWMNYHFPNADDFLSNGRVNVNVSRLYSYNSSLLFDNPKAEATGYYSYQYTTGGGWSNLTATFVPYIRLTFVQSENVTDSRSGAQLQMAAVVSTSSPAYSDPDEYRYNKMQIRDGRIASNDSGAGFGSGDYPLNGSLNFTFKDQIAVCIGDSIMMGWPHHHYDPSQLGVSDMPENTWQWKIANWLGVQPVLGGAYLLTSNMLEHYETDILQNGPDIVFIEGGINDILTTPSKSYSEITTNLRAMYDMAIDNGSRVVAWTISPCNYADETENTLRETVNTWIRAQADENLQVFDNDALMRDSIDNSQLNPAYDYGDDIHLNAAAYTLIAEEIFAQVYRNTAAATTEYIIDRLVFEKPAANDWTGGGIPAQLNISYDGGYKRIGLSWYSQSIVTFEKISTSWLNITVQDIYGLTSSVGACWFVIGELRIFGLPSTWEKGMICNSGWSYIGAIHDKYYKMPFSRTSQVGSASGVGGTLNITMATWNPAVSEYGATFAEWVTTTSTSNTVETYYIVGLSSIYGYMIFKDGDLIATTSGSYAFFTSSGGGEYEIRIWNDESVSAMIILTVNMVGLGIIVSVVGSFVIPIAEDIKKKRDIKPNVLMRNLIRTFVFIIIGLSMWVLLRTIAYG